ncbi:MAG TPA: SGNH/GDSL hydrolase family protein [Cyclobacteriaceae bacterium]|nr:SGNH/GDSL hydrolase family protein [Cyclobacteriaceae bacterium]
MAAAGLVIALATELQAQTLQVKYIALGDSYTIGESVLEKDRWPNQLASHLSKSNNKEVKTSIIATTGWRTDNLMNAITIAKLKDEYDLVSLLIGVNNQYQGKPIEQYVIEFEDLLKISIRLAKGKKQNVFVVSIPDYGFTPFGQKNQTKISKEIDQFNEVNRKITNQYNVKYINITDISRQGINEPSLVAADGLHPSGKMYTLWVERIVKEITLR